MSKPQRLLEGAHYSLDIEACGEVLVSLGACAFDPETGDAGAEFYSVPSIQEQIDAGLEMNGNTFRWWLSIPDAPRRAITANGEQPVREMLEAFRAFLPHDAWLWAYPTSFDLPIIAEVYRRFGVRCPWTWTKTLDARTLWQIARHVAPGIERIEAENPAEHDALNDAKEQAHWIAAYLSAIATAARRAEEVD